MKQARWVSGAVVAVMVVATLDSADAGWGRRKRDAKVNTPAERVMDKNRDGVVNPVEREKAKDVLQKKAVVNRPWEAKADADGNGKVSPAELRTYRKAVMDGNGDGKVNAAERKHFWTQVRAKVNTEVEKKYDANADGVLTGDEAKEYMKDRIRVIATDGRAIVNSDLERDFDANGDGVIDRDEAEAIRDAVEDEAS